MKGRNFHIVLVEDAEADVLLIREALEQAGLEFELEVFDDGEQGVEFVERIDQDTTLARPQLFLLDLNLPKKTGAQILERVRQSPTCGSVPVVILTSSDSRQDKALATHLKATGYFRKPSQLDEFMRLGPYVRDLLVGEGQAKSEGGAFAGA
jgi:two-component system, chemotaxis family, response regulator Rcp1